MSDIRQIITFLVINGFSLRDVRKLYLDELFEYYKFVFFHLEQKGEVKKGTYESIEGMTEKEDTVGNLRKQLMKTKLKNNGNTTNSRRTRL